MLTHSPLPRYALGSAYVFWQHPRLRTGWRMRRKTTWRFWWTRSPPTQTRRRSWGGGSCRWLLVWSYTACWRGGVWRRVPQSRISYCVLFSGCYVWLACLFCCLFVSCLSVLFCFVWFVCYSSFFAFVFFKKKFQARLFQSSFLTICFLFLFLFLLFFSLFFTLHKTKNSAATDESRPFMSHSIVIKVWYRL